MFESLKRGFRMDLESLKLLARFPQLLVLPLVSGLLIIGAWAAVFLPLFFGVPDLLAQEGLLLVAGLTLYFTSFFIAFLFEAALVDAAADHFRGDEVSVKASLAEAWTRKGPLFVWAVIAGTVGLILRLIAQRMGIIGRIVISAIGLVWNLATLLVIPTLLYEDVGAWDGLKRSVTRFKENWGEVASGHIGMGVLFMLIGFGAFLLGIGAIFGLSALGPVGVVAGVLILVTLLVLVGLASIAAKGVFTAAVYTYIQTGEVPQTYTREHIERPFVEG